MSNADDVFAKGHVESSSPPAKAAEGASPAAAVDVESQTAAGSGSGVSAILKRWKREDLIKRGSLAFRGLALLFSILSFIIMASNKHGDWKNFDNYEEFRYVLAIAILATLYTGAQSWRHVQELSTGKLVFSSKKSTLIDFIGDQRKLLKTPILFNLWMEPICAAGICLFCPTNHLSVYLNKTSSNIVAYLLISSASAAIPMTNRMREGADNIFTDSLASSISMSFFAFVALALSAIISGYKLSTQTYI